MNPFDILDKLDDPANGQDLVLYLLKGRSAYRVFRAFDALAPSEAEMDVLLNTPAFLEMIDEVALVFANIREQVAELRKQGLVDTQKYLQIVESHHSQALDATAAFATLLGLDPRDVVSVLMNA